MGDETRSSVIFCVDRERAFRRLGIVVLVGMAFKPVVSSLSLLSFRCVPTRHDTIYDLLVVALCCVVCLMFPIGFEPHNLN